MAARSCPDCEEFKRGIFAGLPDEERRQDLCIMELEHAKRRHRLFSEGDPATKVFLVRKGLVKIFKNLPNERTQIMNLAGPGELVGLEAVFSPTYRTCAETVARTEICKATAGEFLSLLGHRASVALKVVELLHRDLSRSQDFLCDLGTKKAASRVATCLLYFHDKALGKLGPDTFNLPIMRNEMSSLLGVSPETVSRQIKRLVSERLVDVENRRVTIKNMSGLRRLAMLP